MGEMVAGVLPGELHRCAVLVIEAVPGGIARQLAARGCLVDRAGEVAECLRLMNENEYECVLVDLDSPVGASGLGLCQRLAEYRPDLPVVAVTETADRETAISALRAGVFELLAKPAAPHQLDATVRRASKHKCLVDSVRRIPATPVDGCGFDQPIGESPSARELYARLQCVAATDATVLVTGECGTGKELAAQLIHSRSRRSAQPFVGVNCAALPGALLESELFGHTADAFTDAREAHDGLFVQASGGTLFLDEIGASTPAFQVALLRAIEQQRVRPVGGGREIGVDVRIIAATNSNLDEDVEAGRFREDLLYRLDVVRLEIPPLRNRSADILPLVEYFLRRAGAGSMERISPAARRALLRYAWPGNIRELENAIEHAIAVARFDEISLDDLPAVIRRYRPPRTYHAGPDLTGLPTLSEFTRRYVLRVLDAVHGNKSHACRLLGMNRRTLYRKLGRFAQQVGP